MVQIVLIRPGSTDFDEQGRIQGTLDLPLCEQGRAEVQQAIAGLRELGMSVIYASPSESAWQTASMVAEALQIKVKKFDALQNLDYGLWQGMLLEEVKRKNPKVFRQLQEHPETICPPEGETVGDACCRAKAAVVKLQKKHKEGSIGLVIAEPLASIIQCEYCQTKMAEIWKTKPSGPIWQVLGVKSPPIGVAVKASPVNCEISPTAAGIPASNLTTPVSVE